MGKQKLYFTFISFDKNNIIFIKHLKVRIRKYKSSMSMLSKCRMYKSIYKQSEANYFLLQMLFLHYYN